LTLQKPLEPAGWGICLHVVVCCRFQFSSAGSDTHYQSESLSVLPVVSIPISVATFGGDAGCYPDSIGYQLELHSDKAKPSPHASRSSYCCKLVSSPKSTSKQGGNGQTWSDIQVEVGTVMARATCPMPRASGTSKGSRGQEREGRRGPGLPSTVGCSCQAC
jgi:hypothetical protein